MAPTRLLGLWMSALPLLSTPRSNNNNPGINPGMGHRAPLRGLREAATLPSEAAFIECTVPTSPTLSLHFLPFHIPLSTLHYQAAGSRYSEELDRLTEFSAFVMFEKRPARPSMLDRLLLYLGQRAWRYLGQRAWHYLGQGA